MIGAVVAMNTAASVRGNSSDPNGYCAMTKYLLQPTAAPIGLSQFSANLTSSTSAVCFRDL